MIISKDDEYIRYFFTLYLTTDTNVKPRLYLKIDIIALEKFPRLAKQVVTDFITPDEVLVQANKIFAPYTLKFATPLSRFAVWKISKGVARSFSSHDLGVHLVGDVDHVHSVRGAFALNGSIMNAANLEAWSLRFGSRPHLASSLHLLARAPRSCSTDNPRLELLLEVYLQQRFANGEETR